MTTLAYADAFLPTPMASVAMGRAAHLSEATWADEQAVLTPDGSTDTSLKGWIPSPKGGAMRKVLRRLFADIL